MKLNDRSINPPSNGLYFCLSANHGFIGVCLFENEKWFVCPDLYQVSENHNFLWISYEQDI